MVLVYLITRYAFPIKCTEVIYGDNPDEIVEIRAEYDPSKTSKPKVTGHFESFQIQLGSWDAIKYIPDVDLVCIFVQGVLHWVAQPAPGVEPLKVEIRLFEKLFLSEVYSFAAISQICVDWKSFLMNVFVVLLESCRTGRLAG